jgi:hypothetical protein
MLVCVEAYDFLALIAAISNGFTGGTCLQFYFVDFCKPQEAQTSAASPSPSPLIIISVSTFTAIKQSGARDNKVRGCAGWSWSWLPFSVVLGAVFSGKL